jgi:hypothetical protein
MLKQTRCALGLLTEPHLLGSSPTRLVDSAGSGPMPKRLRRIAICRLRQRVSYEEPLTTILDSFYECLLHFIKRNRQHEYSFYNFAFPSLLDIKPNRDVRALSRADIIIIPTEAEFTYWTPGKLHPLDVARSNEQLRSIRRAMSGKRIILLRSDRADSVELYRKRTFPRVKATYKTIDEDDFPLGIHGMKYHFIKERFKMTRSTKRDIDFAYWGSDKRKAPGGGLSNDERHKALRTLQRSELTTRFWGRISNILPYEKWQKHFSDLVPHLMRCRSTLCFNWLDQKAITARYAEALGCGVLPFVWRNYDSTNRVVADEWQRINEPEELIEKLHHKSFKRRMRDIKSDYEERLPSLEEYKVEFSKKLNSLI